MFFKKIKELRKENNGLKDDIAILSKGYEELQTKYKRLMEKNIISNEDLNLLLKENFIKEFHYVLTVDKNLKYVHLYQDGREIKYMKSIDFKAEMDSLPTFNVEVN